MLSATQPRPSLDALVFCADTSSVQTRNLLRTLTAGTATTDLHRPALRKATTARRNSLCVLRARLRDAGLAATADEPLAQMYPPQPPMQAQEKKDEDGCCGDCCCGCCKCCGACCGACLACCALEALCD